MPSSYTFRNWSRYKLIAKVNDFFLITARNTL